MVSPKIPAPPVATLYWSLDVDCPKCGNCNDLARSTHDGENEIAKHIFTNDWDKLKGWEVECDHCAHRFTIDKVEY